MRAEKAAEATQSSGDQGEALPARGQLGFRYLWMRLHPCSFPGSEFQHFLRFCDSANSPVRWSSLEFWSVPRGHSPDQSRCWNSFREIRMKIKEKISNGSKFSFLLPLVFLKHEF